MTPGLCLGSSVCLDPCPVSSFTSQLMCHLLYEPLLTSRVPTRVGGSPLPSVDQLSRYLLGSVTLSVYLSVCLSAGSGVPEGTGAWHG